MSTLLSLIAIFVLVFPAHAKPKLTQLSGTYAYIDSDKEPKPFPMRGRECGCECGEKEMKVFSQLDVSIYGNGSYPEALLNAVRSVPSQLTLAKRGEKLDVAACKESCIWENCGAPKKGCNPKKNKDCVKPVDRSRQLAEIRLVCSTADAEIPKQAQVIFPTVIENANNQKPRLEIPCNYSPTRAKIAIVDALQLLNERNSDREKGLSKTKIESNDCQKHPGELHCTAAKKGIEEIFSGKAAHSLDVSARYCSLQLNAGDDSGFRPATSLKSEFDDLDMLTLVDGSDDAAGKPFRDWVDGRAYACNMGFYSYDSQYRATYNKSNILGCVEAAEKLKGLLSKYRVDISVAGVTFMGEGCPYVFGKNVPPFCILGEIVRSNLVSSKNFQANMEEFKLRSAATNQQAEAKDYLEDMRDNIQRIQLYKGWNEGKVYAYVQPKSYDWEKNCEMEVECLKMNQAAFEYIREEAAAFLLENGDSVCLEIESIDYHSYPPRIKFKKKSCDY